MTTTDECKGRSNRLPRNNQKFMLLFARCDKPYHALWINCANTLRSSTASTPKKTCEHTKGGVYITKVLHIAKGKYIECTTDGISTAKGKHSEYAMQHVRS